MAKFFDLFPTIPYDIQGKQLTNYQNVTNIFFRMRVIREVLSSTSTYYEHLVRDDETPEILADKIYGDPEAHWIILMANDIIDAQYDWPLNYRNFQNYIVNKYGSVEIAKTTLHHYEKVVRREENLSGTVTETRFIINENKLANTAAPFDYALGTGSLATEQTFRAINWGVISKNVTVSNSAISGVVSDHTVIENISSEPVYCFDYEERLNEAKRSIKIIKPEYYGQIIGEFNRLTESNNVPYLRRLEV